MNPCIEEAVRMTDIVERLRFHSENPATGKLVMPGFVASREGGKSDTPNGGGGGGQGGTGGSGPTPPTTPTVDPIIQGLLARLPPSGHEWPEEQRKLWLELLGGSFKLIYKDPPAKG